MTFYIGQPYSDSGTPITINGDDRYFVAHGIIVHSTNSYALLTSGSNNAIDVEGTLTGAIGLKYGGGSSVEIASNGIVAGNSWDLNAISVQRLWSIRDWFSGD